MAEIMLKDLETSEELDAESLAKLIGGHYGKRKFKHYCRHHYHHHHHGHHGHGHWKKYWKPRWNYYKKHCHNW